jgi:hypothetical protein
MTLLKIYGVSDFKYSDIWRFGDTSFAELGLPLLRDTEL